MWMEQKKDSLISHKHMLSFLMIVKELLMTILHHHLLHLNSKTLIEIHPRVLHNTNGKIQNLILILIISKTLILFHQTINLCPTCSINKCLTFKYRVSKTLEATTLLSHFKILASNLVRLHSKWLKKYSEMFSKRIFYKLNMIQCQLITYNLIVFKVCRNLVDHMSQETRLYYLKKQFKGMENLY